MILLSPLEVLRSNSYFILPRDSKVRIVYERAMKYISTCGKLVPPAELEGVLLQHPDIADVGVVGVHSHEEATEYPRYFIMKCQPG